VAQFVLQDGWLEWLDHNGVEAPREQALHARSEGFPGQAHNRDVRVPRIFPNVAQDLSPSIRIEIHHRDVEAGLLQPLTGLCDTGNLAYALKKRAAAEGAPGRTAIGDRLAEDEK